MTELEFHFHAGVAFSAPVREHVFALHCLPVEDAAQTLQSYAISLEPAADYALHRDGFGSWLVCGSCREPHTAFRYDSHGIVQVEGEPQAEPVNPVLKQFTELTAMTDELENLWRSLPLEGKSPQEQAELLNQAAAGALYSEEENLVYAGGGHTVLQFTDEAAATAFARAVTEAAMRRFPGLELFVRQMDYDDTKSPGENLKALSAALERKKALRRASFRRLSCGVERAAEMVARYAAAAERALAARRASSQPEKSHKL